MGVDRDLVPLRSGSEKPSRVRWARTLAIAILLPLGFLLVLTGRGEGADPTVAVIGTTLLLAAVTIVALSIPFSDDEDDDEWAESDFEPEDSSGRGDSVISGPGIPDQALGRGPVNGDEG